MSNKEVTAFDFACSLLLSLETAGFEARLVGGCVRDKLLGLEAKDYDITTNALPEETTKVLETALLKVIPTGVDYGTVTVVSHGHSVEITTLREDVETDGRRARVKFGKSFEKDAARRDFTINSLSSDLRGNVYDYYEGKKHLKEKKIVFVGDPETRIREDFLRILRLYRFKARFRFSYDEALEEILLKTASGLEKVSQERITGELCEIFKSSHLTDVVRSFSKTGLLSILFPFFEQKNSFAKKLIQFLEDLEKLGKKNSLVKFLSAALLISLDGKNSSYVNTVADAAKFLKLSTQKKETILTLVCGFAQISKGFDDHASLLLFAKNCDKRRKKPYFFRDVCVPFWLEMASFLNDETKIIEKIQLSLLVYSKSHYKLLATPLLDAKEIMTLLNLKPGVKLGKVLEERDRVFLNGDIETREDMEVYLKKKFFLSLS